MVTRSHLTPWWLYHNDLTIFYSRYNFLPLFPTLLFITNIKMFSSCSPEKYSAHLSGNIVCIIYATRKCANQHVTCLSIILSIVLCPHNIIYSCESVAIRQHQLYESDSLGWHQSVRQNRMPGLCKTCSTDKTTQPKSRSWLHHGKLETMGAILKWASQSTPVVT